MCVKPEDPDDVATFLYTTEDIKTLWRKNDNSYTLYLSKDFIYNGENNRFLFKKTRAEIVDNLLTIFGEESRQNYINAVSDSVFYGYPKSSVVIMVKSPDKIISMQYLILFFTAIRNLRL